MTEKYSTGPNERGISTAQIDNFAEQLNNLTETEIRDMSDFLYGTLVPTLANNAVVIHEVIFVYAVFMLIKMRLKESVILPTSSTIKFVDESIHDSIDYHYFDDHNRRRYINGVVRKMFDLFLKHSSKIYPSISDN